MKTLNMVHNDIRVTLIFMQCVFRNSALFHVKRLSLLTLQPCGCCSASPREQQTSRHPSPVCRSPSSTLAFSNMILHFILFFASLAVAEQPGAAKPYEA